MASLPLFRDWTEYMKACALVGAASTVCQALYSYTTLPDLIMMYLLVVVFAAVKLGRKQAILTAILGTLALDFLFIPSKSTYTLLDRQYLPTLLGLLALSLVISKLVAAARARADALFQREAETSSLYRLSRDLCEASDDRTMYEAVIRNVESSIASEVGIFHPIEHGITLPTAVSSGMKFSDNDLSVIEDSYTMTEYRTSSGEPDGGPNLLCFPLVQAGSCHGVLVLRDLLPAGGSRRLIEGIIAQTASMLVRIELRHQADQTKIIETRANFERALLNSISHDLRTPLVTITGVLSSIRESCGQLQGTVRSDLVEMAYNEASRLNKFVSNLLDMTRIEAGAVQLNTEPCDLQELTGCALTSLEQRVDTRQIKVMLPNELPPVMLDQLLMTQVLVNLLDNALKYTPPDGDITISAFPDNEWMTMEVADCGQGIPESDLELVFNKFYRIPVPEGVGGTGLGLSICKGIIEAHGGRIKAISRPEGGVRMLLQLPLEKEL